MTPLFWKDIARPDCRICQGRGEAQGRGFKYVCEQCAYNNIMDLRRRLEAAREALNQAAMDLCPMCGVHDRRERRNNHWCHPEHDAVCAASNIWDRREGLR